MNKGILIVIIAALAILGWYHTQIINFLTTPILWKVQPWMIGVWGVWKCSYYIWQKDGEDPFHDEDTGREYRSPEEARYKEYKHLVDDNPGRDVRVENWTDRNGTKYFIIKVFHELGEFIFVPFKKS